jgi:hypothetical protein
MSRGQREVKAPGLSTLRDSPARSGWWPRPPALSPVLESSGRGRETGPFQSHPAKSAKGHATPGGPVGFSVSAYLRPSARHGGRASPFDWYLCRLLRCLVSVCRFTNTRISRSHIFNSGGCAVGAREQRVRGRVPGGAERNPRLGRIEVLCGRGAVRSRCCRGAVLCGRGCGRIFRLYRIE